MTDVLLEFGKMSLYNAFGATIMQGANLNQFVMRDPNIVTRHMKHGALMFGLKHVIKMVVDQPSAEEDMIISNALDDIAYNSIGSFIVERTQLGGMINETLDGVLGEVIAPALAQGIVYTGIDWTRYGLEQTSNAGLLFIAHPVKYVSR